MRRPTKIAILGLLIVLIVPAVGLSQAEPGSEKEVRAGREFEEGKRIERETSLASHDQAWELTLAGFRSALERFANARELYRELGNGEKEAACISKIGRMEDLSENSAKALEHFQQAAKLLSDLNKPKEAALEKARAGIVLLKDRKCGPAKVLFGEALTAAQAAKDLSTEELALSSIGECYALTLNWEKAIEYWASAWKAAEKSGDVVQQARNFKSLGRAYNKMGQRQRALTFYSAATRLLRPIDTQEAGVLEAYALQDIANIYTSLGESRKSIEYELASVTVLEDVGVRSVAAHTLLRVASGYIDLNEPEQALKYCQQALERFRANKNLYGEATTHHKIGQIYKYNFKDYAKARESFERSLAMAKELKNAKLQGDALRAIGDVLFDQPGTRGQEIEFWVAAYKQFQAAKDLRGVADVVYDLGMAYYVSGDRKQSVNQFNLAFLTYGHLGERSRQPETFAWLSIVWKHAGDLKLATAYAKRAVIEFQQLRKDIAGLDPATQRSYLKQVEQTYRRLAKLLITQGRLREAHQVLVALKDEQSLDRTTTPDARREISIPYTEREQQFLRAYPAAIVEIAKHRDRTAEIGRLINEGKATPEERAELAGTGKKMGELFQGFVDNVEAKSQEFSKRDDHSDLVTVIDENKAMWEALRTLSTQTAESTVAIYQLAGDDELDSLIVTPGEIRHVSVAAKDLNQKARTFWALLQSDRYDPNILGKELYDIVFKPLEKELPPGTKTILWSLDGSLRYIPMAAVFDGKQYLVERFNNVTLTRADTSRLTSPVSAKWTATGFGSSKAHVVNNLDKATSFSALPGVGSELNSLFLKSRRTNVLDGEVLLNESFTQKSMLERLAQRRPVVHIASHFSFKAGDERRSFLLLGDGTAFTLADMKKHKDLFAGVELLTLSACNTAAQQADADGREVDAFFELAQRLGAQAVLATLWPVADNSTPWLMREFYDLKVNRHQSKAQALRNSQLALLRGTAKAKALRGTARTDASQVRIVVADDDGSRGDTRAETFVVAKKDAKPFQTDRTRPFSHPYFWSPFVLVGNWR